MHGTKIHITRWKAMAKSRDPLCVCEACGTTLYQHCRVKQFVSYLHITCSQCGHYNVFYVYAARFQRMKNV